MVILARNAARRPEGRMAARDAEDKQSLQALEALSERKFDSPEEAIAALEAGLAAEETGVDRPSIKRRRILRGKLLLRLGEAYQNRQQDDRAENLEKSLVALDKALQAPELKEDDARLWAQIQHDLGRVYLQRVRDDRAENIERAIALYEAALEVRTRDAFPADWAMTQNSLATACAQRVRGDPAKNLEQAISACEAALLFYSRESLPLDWAKAQMNLATYYWMWGSGIRKNNLERAIALYEASLEVCTRDRFPEYWAFVHTNLAVAYTDRIGGIRATNLERAVALCMAALEVYTRVGFPHEWARAQMNLANAYAQRIYSPKADNLERAIACYEAALCVRTREALPAYWAMTQMNLAITYCYRICGVKADNLDRAITLFEGVLEVYKDATHPRDWAYAKMNSAIAYVGRIHGDKADNIDEAIACNEAALAVCKREVFPAQWATIQMNLADEYRQRIHGEKAENLEHAIGLLEAALTVRTANNAPRDYLRTSCLLGLVFLELKRWRQSFDALLAARESFLLLLGEGLEGDEARGLIEAAGPLFACAAYAAAEMGNSEQALGFACEGRARLLATALRLRRLDLPAAEMARAEELRTNIREQSRALEQVGGLQRTETLDRLAQLRSELAGFVAKSEERAGKREPMAEAERICADGTVIVVPVVTDVGGKLLIVAPASDPQHHPPRLVVVDVPELTSERMKTLMRGEAEREDEGWLSAFARDIAFAERKRRSVRAVEHIGAQLWTLLAGPLEGALKELGIASDAPLAFLPSSGFGLLPLGLAEEPSSGRRLIERREIVCAPSLAALDRANRAASQVAEQAAPSLAMVINPTGDLIYAPIEGALAAAGFAERVMLDQSNATPADVLASLKGKSHWHFATHGVFDLEEARRSALAMKDGGGLSVDTLLEAEDLGRPRLVVLSACETGLHDVERLPEEFVGFPGAFMTMGAQAVLGTLWSVDDCAATLLTAHFYDGHLQKSLAPAAALREAQLWLASATREELAAYAQQKGAQNRLAATAVRQLEAAIAGAGVELVRFFNVAAANRYSDQPPFERAGEEPTRPFAHPIYWGGFVLTGR
jgi:CHAT domain-containing protein/tetratricopeptide (TPR) repeat protein